MSTLASHIRRLQRQVSGIEKEIETYQKLEKRYPGIKVNTDRNGVRRLYSSVVNCGVDTLNIGPHCDCHHSPCVIWAYLVDQETGQRIFSDPLSFVIAHRPEGGLGEEPDPNWRRRLQEAGISDVIQEKVARYLANHPAIADDEESPA